MMGGRSILPILTPFPSMPFGVVLEGKPGNTSVSKSVQSDALGQVADDVGPHQLAEELLLLGYVVSPRLQQRERPGDMLASTAFGPDTAP